MPASSREHLVTVAFGLWMTVGLFLDGAFHQELDGDTETLLTPWHGVFYSGFLASTWWLATMSRRRAPTTVDWQLRFLPDGYHAARTGLILFAAGGAADGVWHGVFGVERGIDALLSPTHLLLFVGLVLVLTSPYRAALAGSASSASVTPWIVAGAVISATALVGFFLNFAWGLGIAAFARTPYDPVTGFGETQVVAGVASTLVTTVVLFGSARLLRPPAAIATLFLVVPLLVSAAFDEDIEGVVAALVAGICLAALCRTGLPRSTAFAAASAILWFGYFGLLASEGVRWQAEIWVGAGVLNVITAYVIGAAERGELDLEPKR